MHLPHLIHDLAIILGVAAIVTYLCRRFKQPVVLGYVIAGFVVGPYAPGLFSVEDTSSVKTWAELGVIFLMFTLGLEFSFRRLTRVGVSTFVTAFIELSCMFGLGYLMANVFGYKGMNGIFLGSMIAISSTTIIIKTFDELNLKSKKFADFVFGLLIVEDLAAILLMVALTNMAVTSEVDGLALLLAAGKLVLIIGLWFLIGFFAVPRFVGTVSRYGNDEMLVIVSVGLCLALVALAAYFNYSIALGAFIMGSIIAESKEAHRIEVLVRPLRDIFGAVFFVSVGMLLDPKIILQNLGLLATICLVILGGKIAFVTAGSLITGQSIRNALRSGSSMAQIGEFSFIIASLGALHQVIDPGIFPVIVAASVVTTFTTPYLVKSAVGFSVSIERNIPPRIRIAIDNYGALLQLATTRLSARGDAFREILIWWMHAGIMATVFTVSATTLLPWLLEQKMHADPARSISWVIAFLICVPNIWNMTVRRTGKTATSMRTEFVLLKRGTTIGILGLLSLEYFPAVETLLTTVLLWTTLFWLFRAKVASHLQWIEKQIKSHIFVHPTQNVDKPAGTHLAPWDAHLVEIDIPANSFLVGKTIAHLEVRKKFGVNIVILERQGQTIISPSGSEILYPQDKLLCFATDEEIERLRDAIQGSVGTITEGIQATDYQLRSLLLQNGSPLVGKTIFESRIQSDFNCTIVGMERTGSRIKSPRADTILQTDDILWIIGDSARLMLLEESVKT